MADHGTYYVPEHSSRPIMTAIGLFFLGLGAIFLTEEPHVGLVLAGMGAVIIVITLFLWFRDVVIESRKGLHDDQMDRTYRWGMFWFLFAQFMLMGGFFGTLVYASTVVLPTLSGTSGVANHLTHLLLWPNFSSQWPPLQTPNPQEFIGPHHIVTAWGWPAINTLLMLISVITLAIAHHSMNKRGHNKLFNICLIITFIIGIIVAVVQFDSIISAASHYGITLGSGIYGSFFMMIHVLVFLNIFISLLILLFLIPRCWLGHFNQQRHFAIDAISWLWYFSGAMWLITFILVYLF